MTEITSRPEPKLDPRFVIERQGRRFALFLGLLDLAHQQGLKRISTELVLIADETNGQTWGYKATVETQRGTFTGHGEANPANVARAMLGVTFRLAETRALARALRFATNVEMVAVEELTEDELGGAQRSESHPETSGNTQATQRRTVDVEPAAQPTTAGRASPQPAPQNRAPVTPVAPVNSVIATPAQIRAIYSIGHDQHGMDEREVDERSQTMFGAPPAELTRKQASDLITTLKGGDRR